jgi:acetylornithine aminotransferase
VTEETAAVFLEPIQGEGGLVTPPVGYLAEARAICDDAGALLVVDEVQSGIARSGSWFASRGEAVLPDVVTLAKGLAGGLPIGAAIGIGRAATLLRPGDHATTFGGNPVACAAALAVLDEIEENDLLSHVRSVGAHLADRLRALQDPLLAAVRGRGLWLGLVLSAPIAGRFEAASRERGFLVNAVAPAVVRLAPPLIVTDVELNGFVEQVPEIAREAERAA